MSEPAHAPMTGILYSYYKDLEAWLKSLNLSDKGLSLLEFQSILNLLTNEFKFIAISILKLHNRHTEAKNWHNC